MRPPSGIKNSEPNVAVPRLLLPPAKLAVLNFNTFHRRLPTTWSSRLKSCLVLDLAVINMLHMSASTSSPSTFASRKDYSTTHVSEIPRSNRRSLLASAVLIVPLMDESHADLLMIPISDDNRRFHKPQRHHQHSPSSSSSTTSNNSRTETPAAPTPAPKPQLPEEFEDWDSYLSQRKSSTATLPLIYDDESEWIKTAVCATTTRIQPSPELTFQHSFENLGWRDCLSQTQRRKADATTAKAPRDNPAATTLLLPLVYDATSPGNSTSAASARSARRLSNASTLTANTILPTITATTTTTATLLRTAKRLSTASTNTANTVPCYLPSTAYKRLSGASTNTTNTAATVP